MLHDILKLMYKEMAITEVNEFANRFIDKPSQKIIEKAMLLKKHYVFLPSEVIESLQSYEDSIFQVLRMRKFDRIKDVETCRENLIKVIRQSTANLLSGETTLDKVLKENPVNGFTPKYLQEMLGQNTPSNDQT